MLAPAGAPESRPEEGAGRVPALCINTRLCLGCRDFIKAGFKGKAREDVVAVVHKTAEAKQKYDAGLAAYELAQNEAGPTGRVSKKTLQHIEMPEVTQVVQSATMQGDMACGVFWPFKVYEEIQQKALPRKLRTRYCHNGQWFTGIVLPDSEGNPTGTIKLRQISSTSVQNVKVVDSSEGAVRDGQVSDTFKRARAAISVGVQGKKVELDGETVQSVKIRKKGCLKSSADDEDDDWINVIGKATSFGSFCSGGKTSAASSNSAGDGEQNVDEDDDDGDGGGLGTRTSGARRHGANAKRASGAKVAPNPVKKPRPVESLEEKGGKIYPSVQQREIVGSQAVLSEADRMLESAQMQEGLKSLTESRVRLLLAKVAKKIEPKNSYILTYFGQDVKDSWDDLDEVGKGNDLQQKGETVLSSLTVVGPKLEALADLVACIEHSNVTEFSGSPSQLHFAIEQCRVALGEVPLYASIVLVHRQLSLVFQQADYSLLGKLLTTTTLGDALGEYYGLWLLGSESVISRQQDSDRGNITHN